MTTDRPLTDAQIDAAAFREAWRVVFGPASRPRRPQDAYPRLAACSVASRSRSGTHSGGTASGGGKDEDEGKAVGRG